MSDSTARRGRPPAVLIHADRLRDARERRQLTQAQLANAARITHRTLRRAEADGRASKETVRVICEALSVPVMTLLRSAPDDVDAKLRGAGLAVPATAGPWTGRDEAVARLSAALDEPGLTVVLGPTGMGKTTLVQRVLAEVSARFPEGIVWLNLEPGAEPAALRSLLRRVARALDFEAQLPDPGEATLDALAQSFRHHFWRGERALVLDGVVGVDVVTAFRGAGHLLVTTTRQHVADALGGRVIALGPLGRAAARGLLEAFVPPTRLARDEAGTQRLVALTRGVPRVVCLVGSVLGRERLTSPASCAERLAAGGGGADVVEEALVERAHKLVSEGAWRLLGALTVFGVEPFPLSWTAAVSDAPRAEVERLVSELVDVFFVRVAANDEGGETWVALDHHSAWLHGRLLDAEARARLEGRLDGYVAAAIERAHRDGAAAGWRWYLRHEGLITRRVTALMAGVGAGGSLRDVASIEALPDRSEHPLAGRLAAIVLALNPILISKNLGHAGDWLRAGLEATGPRAGTVASARMRFSTGVWRTINRVGVEDELSWWGTFWRDLSEAGRPTSASALLAVAVACLLLAEPRLDARGPYADAVDAARAAAAPVDRAILLGSAATCVVYCAPDAAAYAEAVALSDEALEGLADAGESWVRAVIAMNRATYRIHAGGREAASALEAAAAMAMAHAPEDSDVLRAVILAHAAHYGARVGHASAEAARAEAYRLWRAGMRDCAPEDIARATWIINSAAMILALRRMAPGHPVVAAGFARLGCPAPGMVAPSQEMVGFHSLLLLSLDAMMPLFDDDTIDLALGLADHAFADGVRFRADLTSVRALLTGAAPV